MAVKFVSRPFFLTVLFFNLARSRFRFVFLSLTPLISLVTTISPNSFPQPSFPNQDHYGQTSPFCNPDANTSCISCYNHSTKPVRRTAVATDVKTVPHSVLYSGRSILQVLDLLRFIPHWSSARFLVLHDRPFFMADKDLCRIESLAFWVAFTGSVHEGHSLSTKSQVRSNRFLSFSCFALRTVLYGI